MNWFTGTSWLWRAWRGQSVTFAALFASAVLGFSLLHGLRAALGALGVPWYGLILIPLVTIAVLSRREADWIPDVEARRRWSRRLVFGSLGLAFLIAWLTPEREAPQRPVPSGPVRTHGPSGK